MALPLIGPVVDEIVVHEVARRGRSAPPVTPVLSNAPSPLTEPLSQFFADKIARMATARECIEVRFGPERNTTAASICSRWFAGNENLVTASQRLAVHLSDVQTGVASAGLLATASCRIGAQRYLAILKLENEEGVRLLRGDFDSGGAFQLEHIKDLLLSRKTRLFKQAVLFDAGGGTFAVHVTDTQNPGVATFFIRDFLGCSAMVDPRVATKGFFEAVTAYANTQVADPAERQKLMLDLASYLASNEQVVNPDTFAGRHLPQGRMDAFRAFVAEHGAVPGAIHKDTDLLRNRIARIMMRGASGITISGPRDAYEEHVEASAAGEETRLVITDRFEFQE